MSRESVYLYEVESYWYPIKKQPSQKRKYVGKKDLKTGEIITPKKGIRPRHSRCFGYVYLLENIAKRMEGSKECIWRGYGKEYIIFSLF